MFVEMLEQRCLLSATAGVGVHLRTPPNPFDEMKDIADVLDNAKQNGEWDGTFPVKSGPTRIKLEFIMKMYETFVTPSAATRSAATSSFSFSLSLEKAPQGIFDPGTVFGSLPTTYNFTLNPKNPLNLFSIKESSGGNTLQFTGKMSKNLKGISGVLKITGPHQHTNFTYTAVPAS